MIDLLTGGNGLLIGLGAAIIAIVSAFIKGRISGANAERAKQAEGERKARDIADEIENEVEAMSGAEARKEISRWSPKS